MTRRQVAAAGVALALVSLLAGFGVAHLAGMAPPKPHRKPSAALGDAVADEACLEAAINTDRQVAGVPTLPIDGALAIYARSHSQAQADAGIIYHSGGQPVVGEQIPTGTQFRAAIPVPWRGYPMLGENVGEDSAGCVAMNQVYMFSPEHRANILGSAWTGMAVGVAYDSSGTLYSTEDFFEAPTAPSQPPPSPPPSPPTAAPRIVPSPARSSCTG